MKIETICLLRACKRRKFKMFGDSSQVRAIDNGITCCYWSASRSNRLRALKAHSSLFKCCEKNCPNFMNWIQLKHRGSWIFLRLLRLIFIVLLIFYLFLHIFLIRGGGCHWKWTAAEPKSNIGPSKKWHWQGRKVAQAPKCHIGVL